MKYKYKRSFEGANFANGNFAHVCCFSVASITFCNTCKCLQGALQWRAEEEKKQQLNCSKNRHTSAFYGCEMRKKNSRNTKKSTQQPNEEVLANTVG